MDLVGRFAYIFVLLAVGVGARRLGALTDARNERLGQVAFYVLLPALVFVSTYDQQLQALFSVKLAVGLVAVLVTLLALSWLVNRRGADDVRSVALVQSYHGNLGYFGLPVVAATLGSTAAATASVILGLLALIQVPLTILILVNVNDADATVGAELRNVVMNPILVTLAVSLVIVVLDLPVPGAVDTSLSGLSMFALPVALLAVGGSLKSTGQHEFLFRTGTVVVLKILVMPLVAWMVFSGLGTEPLTRNVGIVMFGTPSAVSTYVYTSELGGDVAFASMNVFTTTVASLISLFFILQLLV